MPVCFPDSSLCIILSVTSTIPLIHIVYGYLQHNYQDYYLQEKEKFKGSRRNFVLNYFSLGMKICMLSSLIVFAFSQAVFNLVYHTKYFMQNIESYWIITFLELVIIVTYCLQIVMFIYDALQYGQTTLITIINLTIQMVTYYLFVCVIFFAEGSVINQNDVCWILFLVRGIEQLLFLISTILVQQDKQLIQTIVTEYEYQQSLITQEEKDQQNQQESQNKNVSIFTFNGDITNNNTNDTITDIEVKKFKESDKYDKKTIIYEITFIYSAQNKRVYRSFREFLGFYHDLKTHYFGVELPLFPYIKPTSKTLSPEDIEERRCLLDQFMKGIITNKEIEGGALLQDFLNLNQKTPQYVAKYPIPQKTSKVKRANISVPKSKKTYDSIPETIWEGQLEEDEDEEEDDRSRTSRRIRSYQVHQDLDKDRTLDKYQSMDDRMDINEKQTYKFQFEEEEKHSSEEMNIS